MYGEYNIVGPTPSSPIFRQQLVSLLQLAYEFAGRYYWPRESLALYKLFNTLC